MANMDVELFTKLVPYAVSLGLEMISVDADTGRCVMRQPWRDELVGDPERENVHGGVITALLDTIGGACVFAYDQKIRPQATLDLRIDYLRPAAPRLDLLAEAVCYRVTRHIAFVRGLCHQGDPEKPVANMTATFIIADRPELRAGPRS